MMNWFSKKQEEVVDLSLPKVKDYPKGQYAVYWEIVDIPEGKEIRFMSYKTGLVDKTRVNHDPSELARVIRNKMAKYKEV